MKTIAAWTTVVLVWVGFLGLTLFGRAWPLELFTHFYPQYGVGLLLLSAGLLYGNQRWATLFVGLLAAWLLGPPLVDWIGREVLRSTVHGPAELSIVLFNSGSRLTAFQELLRDAGSSPPDIVFLLEVRPRYRPYLQQLRDTYPHQFVRARNDNFGLAVLSRRPLTDTRVVWPEASPVPWWTGRIDERVSVLLVHTVPPVSKRLFDVRNRQLAWLQKRMREDETHDVILGDFNVSPGSPYFGDLMGPSGWRHHVDGNSLYFTWGGDVPLVWTAIDHVFYRPDRVRPADIRIGSNHGSDHFPVYVGLGLREGT